MSELLFRADPYRTEAPGRVVATGAEGVRLDASLFYPTGGGQPGDRGELAWDGGACAICDCVKGPDGAPVLIPAEGAAPPPAGTQVAQRLDGAFRAKVMRMHTALHLLSVAIPLPVTGGSIGEGRSRLDFAMPEPPQDKPAIEAEVNRLIDADLPVTEEWIDEAELDANPGLVKTLRVRPPRGSGRIRLIRIGAGEGTVDLQPCGGTHVRRTGEIGAVALGKVEKKGRENRRVYLTLAD
ncbi:MAG: alanyl-tRNA editing protein [Hasllibacter sp.]